MMLNTFLMQKRRSLGILFCGFFSHALFGVPAYRIGNQTFSVEEAAKKDASAFYELEKKKYDLIHNQAAQAYLDFFWTKLAKEKNITVDQAREQYLQSKIKISDEEVKSTFEKFKDHPSLSKLPKEEQTRQIKDYLQTNQTRILLGGLIQDGLDEKTDFEISYPEPTEPLYKISLTPQDHVRFSADSTTPLKNGCQKAEECPIVLVEYTDMQCPFCLKVQPSLEAVMKEYAGKIAMVSRDFALQFHTHAEDAAVANHCAAEQDKFWPMYKEIFKNQGDFSNPAIKFNEDQYAIYAKNVGLDVTKFKACFQKSEKIRQTIQQSAESATRMGVSATPTFFINGRKVAGALSLMDFKKIIDSELRKKAVEAKK